MIVFLRIVRLVIHLLVGMAICALVFPWVDRQAREVHVRRWSRYLLAICNVQVQITGGSAVPRAQALVVSNHVSWLDIFVLNALYPCRFVAKAEIRSWPLAGWLVEQAGTVFIARGSRRDLRRAFEGLVTALKGGERVAFFPEGTTAPQGTLLPFHANLFQAAVDAKARVQPYAIRYIDSRRNLHPAVEFIGEMTFAQSVMAIMSGKPIHARVTILRSMKAENLNRREMAERSYQAIRQALGIPAPAEAEEAGLDDAVEEDGDPDAAAA
ncbi:1-acyl-sn-glycerol-3-phosphate acyltransferase [Pseudoduganella lurida]|uniref:1-acyl-sn-glycerol-3-phosphate acyltransferase n=1 Tax=Pseudoduganella lurida TaxID=1036180 RepID=A0A562R578_9BURK|nr:lysophospholipid acyltransferase family protein [Pseudoduganella lurida]TWI64217.1 1-acyl-sn-glycerol-3-phosphate acyltransferase [Pseudoduganella lurida]